MKYLEMKVHMNLPSLFTFDYFVIRLLSRMEKIMAFLERGEKSLTELKLKSGIMLWVLILFCL